MEKIVKLLSILVITSCGVAEAPEIQTVDTRLRVYFEEFRQVCKTQRTDCDTSLDKIKSVTVSPAFPPDLKDALGLCYLGNKYNHIVVHSSVLERFWQEQRALMFHEIAHCAYGLDHVSEHNKLMSEYMPLPSTIIYEWDRLVDEMFTQIKTK
jgi:hypothetical protein